MTTFSFGSSDIPGLQDKLAMLERMKPMNFGLEDLM